MTANEHRNRSGRRPQQVDRVTIAPTATRRHAATSCLPRMTALRYGAAACRHRGFAIWTGGEFGRYAQHRVLILGAALSHALIDSCTLLRNRAR
jgi:hypothetical protein